MRVSFSLGSLLGIQDVQWCLAQMASRGEPDAVWVPETWGMECFSMLSAAAVQTHSARIGSSIINVYSRSPALVGMGAATIDTLSGGRLVLGLGTSSAPIVEDFHGYGFKRPVARMREYIEIIRLVMSGQKVDYDGQFFRLRNFALLTRPPRKSVPIYLAAVNRRMVDLACELADGVIFYLRPKSEMAQTVRTMRKGGNGMEVACQIITAVSTDSQKAIERARKTLAFYVAVGGIYRRFLAENGYRKETEAVVDEYRRSGTGGDMADHIPDRMLRDLTIYGTPEEAASQLSGFTEAGVGLPILQFNPVGDVKESFGLLYEAFMGGP